jgi:hypothetical protein
LFSACLSPSVCIRRRRRRSGRYSESFISSKLPFRLGDHDDATGIAAYAMGSTVIATPAEPNQSALRDAAIDVFRELVDAVAKVKENHKHLALNSRARDHEVSKNRHFLAKRTNPWFPFHRTKHAEGAALRGLLLGRRRLRTASLGSPERSVATTGLGVSIGTKWRRKPLETLKTGD